MQEHFHPDAAKSECGAPLTHGEIAAVLVITICAAVLRCWQWTESLWLDELHTAWSVAGGWSQVEPRAAMGNQSPLYYWWVWLVVQGLGLNEPALRLTSVVAGAGLVPAAYWTLRRWTGSAAAGLAAAAMLAVDRTCLFYAQEARPYACVQLAGAFQVMVFWSILQRPDWRKRLAFISLTVLLFYLHYTSVLLLAAEFVFLVGWSLVDTLRRRHPVASQPLWPCLCDLAVIAVCSLPRFWHLLEIAQRKDNWAAFIPQEQPVSRIATLFPVNTYLVAPLVLFAAGWFCAFAWRWWFRSLAKPAKSPASTGAESAVAIAGFVLVWWFVPVAVAWLLTRSDTLRIFHGRYVIVAAAAPVYFAALCCGWAPGRWWKVISSMVVIGLLVWTSGYLYQLPRDGRLLGDRVQNWRAAAEYVRAGAGPSSSPVFVRSGLIESEALPTSGEPALGDYCLLPVLGIYGMGVDRERLIPLPLRATGDLTDAQVDRIAAAQDSWFLLSATPEMAIRIEGELVQRLAAAGIHGLAVQRQGFGNVTVLRLRIKPHHVSAG